MDRTTIKNPYKEQDSFRETLIQRYLPLVKNQADRLSMGLPPHVGKEDLIGSGLIGLWKAIDTFDSSRGVPFEAFAVQCVRRAMLDELRSLSWAPRSFFRRLREWEEAKNKLATRLGREPEPWELAGALSLKEKDYQNFLAEINRYAVASLEDFLFSGTESRLSSITSMQREESPESKLLKKEKKEILAREISQLPAKEKLILSLYYFEKLSLKEIARLLKVSPPRVSQLHGRALWRLRQNISSYFAE